MTTTPKLQPESLSSYFRLPHLSHRRVPLDKGVQALYVVPLCAAVFLGWVAAGNAPSLGDTAALVLVSLIIVVGTLLLRRAYRVTSQTVAEVNRIICRDQRNAYSNEWQLLFLSRNIDRFAMAFAAIGFVLTVSLQAQLSGLPLVLFLILAAFGWMLNGYGLALAVCVIRWIDSLGGYPSLRVCPIPAHTGALRMASRLSGVLALQFCIQTSLEIATFFLIPWESAVAVRVVIWTLMFPLAIVSLTFFVRPQFVLAHIVQRERTRAIHEVERLLKREKLLPTLREHRNVTRISSLMELHRQLQESPQTPLDMGTVIRLVPSFVLAVLTFGKDALELRRLFADLP